MENQHRKIDGYRELSEKEIALMNKVKSLSKEVGELVSELRPSVASSQTGMNERKSAGDDLDQRWVSIGEDHLQLGFMALVRSIAKPTTF